MHNTNSLIVYKIFLLQQVFTDNFQNCICADPECCKLHKKSKINICMFQF